MKKMMKKNNRNALAVRNSLRELGTLSELYGETATMAFLVREAKIKQMSLNWKDWRATEIMHLHEQNFRLLKHGTIQPWFIIDVYGNMIPVPKHLPTSNAQLRSAC